MITNVNVLCLSTRTVLLLQVFIPPLEQINIDDILKVQIFSMTSESLSWISML